MNRKQLSRNRENRYERSNVAIFLTGSTGYIGAHVAANLLDIHGAALNCWCAARTRKKARIASGTVSSYTWISRASTNTCRPASASFRGDLTSPQFGLNRDDYDRLVHTTDSVVHCAASLNRKSEKSCMNVNLRGTLEVLQLARHVARLSWPAALQQRQHRRGGRASQQRSGHRRRSIDWDRSDYDPYARTKKFCEHMVHELLPDVPITIFRPSIVLGDSRYAETTQFDMVRAFVFLAGCRCFRFVRNDKIDIVNVDFVADAIVPCT